MGLHAAWAIVCATIVAVREPALQVPQNAEVASQAEPKGTSGAAVQDEFHRLTAAQLQDAMIKRYRLVNTYQDEEVVRQDLHGPVLTRRAQPVKVAFERDGRFRWEVRQQTKLTDRPSNPFVIWSSDQKTFKSWWTSLKRLRDFHDMDMPLSTARGIAGAVVDAVLPLLRGSAGRWRFAIDDPVDDGVERIDGVECRKIKGKVTGWKDRTGSLWIDSALRLRRIYERSEFTSNDTGSRRGKDAEVVHYTTEMQIELAPQLDGPIPDEAFEPPETR